MTTPTLTPTDLSATTDPALLIFEAYCSCGAGLQLKLDPREVAAFDRKVVAWQRTHAGERHTPMEKATWQKLAGNCYWPDDDDW